MIDFVFGLFEDLSSLTSHSLDLALNNGMLKDDCTIHRHGTLQTYMPLI